MKPKPASLNISDSDDNHLPGVEQLVKAVENFEIDSTNFSKELDQYLSHVAKTGDTLLTWSKVKKVFIHKLKLVMDDFYHQAPYEAGKVNANCENEKFEYLKEIFIKQTSTFESAPFTFQRLCELVQNPKQNYTKCEKFMRALEKNLLIVSSWCSHPSRRLTDQGANGSVEYNTPSKTESLSVMSYPPPRSAPLPPSPMLTSSPNLAEKIFDSVRTSLSEAMESVDKENELLNGNVEHTTPSGENVNDDKKEDKENEDISEKSPGKLDDPLKDEIPSDVETKSVVEDLLAEKDQNNPSVESSEDAKDVDEKNEESPSDENETKDTSSNEEKDEDTKLMEAENELTNHEEMEADQQSVSKRKREDGRSCSPNYQELIPESPTKKCKLETKDEED